MFMEFPDSDIGLCKTSEAAPHILTIVENRQ